MKLKRKVYNVSSIEQILNERFPDRLCPECSKNGVYAGGIDKKYDEENEEEILNSFSVFCEFCGSFLGGWDNTNRVRWIK